MARLGDEHLDVGVADVGEEVLVAPGVVEAHHRRPGQGRTGQAEHVVGGVVEQDANMGRARRVEPLAEQGGEAGGLGVHLGVAPDALAEVQRRPRREFGVGAVAAHQLGGIGGRQRCFARRRCQRHALDHVGWSDDMRPGRGAFSDHGVRLDKPARR